MSLKNNVIVTLLYEDDTTRTYTFENVQNDAIMTVKAKILAVNANSDGEYDNFYQIFVSDDGEAVTKIESCKIVSVEEEILYEG